MNKKRKPLTLKDIEAQTRELMAQSQGRPGLSISEWVSVRMREAALGSVLRTDFNEKDIPIHQ